MSELGIHYPVDSGCSANYPVCNLDLIKPTHKWMDLIGFRISGMGGWMGHRLLHDSATPIIEVGLL